jgi:hypothetical protein
MIDELDEADRQIAVARFEQASADLGQHPDSARDRGLSTDVLAVVNFIQTGIR